MLQTFLGTQDNFSDPISIRTPWENCSQPTATTCLRWSWRLKHCFRLASVVKKPLKTPLSVQRSDHYAILMGPSMGKTAVHGYHHVVVAVRLHDYLGSNELINEPLQSAYKKQKHSGRMNGEARSSWRMEAQIHVQWQFCLRKVLILLFTPKSWTPRDAIYNSKNGN